MCEVLHKDYRFSRIISDMLGILFCIALAFPVSLAAAQQAEIPPEVEEYSLALQAFRDASAKQPVEPVFALGLAAADSLLEVLEFLDDAAYELASKKMEGFIVGREEIIVAEPDYKFFGNLAAGKGSPQDIALFALYQRTLPGGVWPAYIEQRADMSGCTLFGKNLLVDLYGAWTQFSNKYPEAYKTPVGYKTIVAQEISRIEQRLLAGSCACGGTETVIAELHAFLEKFPQSAIAGRIRERAANVAEDRAGIRFNCNPG